MSWRGIPGGPAAGTKGEFALTVDLSEDALERMLKAFL